MISLHNLQISHNVFAFIGIANALGMLSCIFISPFAKRLIKWLGDINMVCFGNLFIAMKLLLYALIV